MLDNGRVTIQTLLKWDSVEGQIGQGDLDKV